MTHLTTADHADKGAGSQAEKQAGTKAGRKAGTIAGRKAGMEAGRNAGTKAGRKAGTKEGRKVWLERFFRILAYVNCGAKYVTINIMECYLWTINQTSGSKA